MKNKKQTSPILRRGILLLALLVNSPLAHSHEGEFHHDEETPASGIEIYHDDAESFTDAIGLLVCNPASASQVSTVNRGNDKKSNFLARCLRETGNSSWCQQLVRPNPSSINKFRCTYGNTQVHQLIHPEESTWGYAIGAVKLVQHLQSQGLKVCEIYNWWRPEPYNGNVGGAAGRHPYGTSVDVRMCSNREAILAFDELCKQRKLGRLRAIGYYGNTGLHFGVGDRSANTWGRSCPN